MKVKKDNRLLDVKVGEVSLVDNAAIRRKFIIMKRDENNEISKMGGEEKMTIEELKKLGLLDEDFEIPPVKEEDTKEKDSKTVFSKILEEFKILKEKILGKKDDKTDSKVSLDDSDVKKVKDMIEELTSLISVSDTAKKEDEGVKKLLDEVTKLKVEVEKTKKDSDIVSKIRDAKDVKELAVTISEIRKKEEGQKTVIEKLGDTLDIVSKRLESLELQSKGLKGQETVTKKTSEWGGAFL